jgi:hypothetical protein
MSGIKTLERTYVDLRHLGSSLFVGIEGVVPAGRSVNSTDHSLSKPLRVHTLDDEKSGLTGGTVGSRYQLLAEEPQSLRSCEL